MDFLVRTVGGRVSERRKAVGWSQARLAAKVNLSTETISRLETGAAMPSLTRLAAIARVLDVDLPDLFRRDDGDEHQRALDHLRALMSGRTAKEIELIAAIAGPILDFVRQPLWTSVICIPYGIRRTNIGYTVARSWTKRSRSWAVRCLERLSVFFFVGVRRRQEWLRRAFIARKQLATAGQLLANGPPAHQASRRSRASFPSFPFTLHAATCPVALRCR